MKFLEIFRFEFAYQLRRPWPWLFFAVLLVLDFLMTRDGSLSEVLYAEFFLNSPFAIAKTTVFGSLIWLVMAAAIAGDAGARDVAEGMYPLFYTTPLSKAEYLGGRFLAALLLNALILLAVQAGILLGVYLPGVDAILIGPFRPAAFLTAYAFIALPNAFLATALQFSLAAKSGRAMAAYFGSFLIVFIGFFVASILLYSRGMGTLMDPIGIRFLVEDLAHVWTTVEKNSRLLELKGSILTNRLLWLGVALVTLAVCYLSFRFAHRTGSTPLFGSLRSLRTGWWRKLITLSPGPAILGTTSGTPASFPQVSRSFGIATHARQTLAIARASFHTIATSWAGLALLIVIPLLTIPVVFDQMVSRGVPLVPTSIQVISELTASLADELSRWVIIPFLIVFFAGELVWREREAGLGEITDTIPGSEWAPFLGKFLGLSLLLTVFMAFLTTAGMLAQLILGYQEFEPGLYLKIMFGIQLPEYLLFALLALVIHVLVNQKYAGHLVAIIAYVFIALASLFGVEHNLLIYSAGPGWSYTEMRGFGGSLVPWLWFKLYWAAWALLLAVVARLLWVRGREKSFRLRLQGARHRFSRSTAWTATVAMGLIILLGGFIFYNTNVLNEYLSTSETKELAAGYERRYGRYANVPQPLLSAASLQVEIYPERRTVDIRGTYLLLNSNETAIDTVHLTTVSAVDIQTLNFGQAATPVLSDEELGHRIYALKEPLQPGDSLQLNFELRVAPRGFRESGVDPSLTKNGTFFTNAWLPAIGYQRSRELLNAADRREYGLAPRPLIASLYEYEAKKSRGKGISFEAVVGTHEDQLAVAPGALRKTWTKGNRRYFHYTSDQPIGGEWAFFSANYAMHEAQWKNPDSSGQNVMIQIFHHPQHKAHLNRLVRGIRSSLDYYTRQFGPYQYNYISVVERAGNGTGMHADAGMITHAEGFTQWNPKDDPKSLDVPEAVVAHEMAHQWTVPYANVEGAPVMSESIAWYYAIKAVENARGPRHLKQLLSWLRQPYRREIRRGEPLLRGLDPYMSYRKGPFALYTLSEYIGEKQINQALRHLLEKHRRQEAPLATTLDLYRELQIVTPDSLQYLLHDLFEVNTYWELEMQEASAQQTESGNWQVTLEIQAHKEIVDSAGLETEVPMHDWIEIGLLAPAAGAESGESLYLQKHLIRSGQQTIKVMVPGKPVRAGIDPHYLMIDQNTDNNIVEVRL